MPSVIVSDASCLILLEKINQLSILERVFGKVVVTDIVAEEFGNQLPTFIEVKQSPPFGQILNMGVTIDDGEASSLALCQTYEDQVLLIIDDKAGRGLAERLKIPITGTLGVLLEAKHKGVITSLKRELDKVAATDFRISPTHVKWALKLAGE